MTYDELAAVYDDNCEPFSSVEQCDLFIKAANVLWRREKDEAEHSGERYKTRDYMRAIERAEKAKKVLLFTCQPGEVIVTPDRLR